MPWTDLIIETARVRLRAFEEGDKPTIFELRSSPDVRRYLGGPAGDDVLAALAVATVGERPGVFCVADRETDAAIGTVSLGDQHGEQEVGYEFVTGAWGRGLASEALKAFLDWYWTAEAAQSIIAVTQTANASSCRLLERHGFVFERQFLEWEALQSQYRLSRDGDGFRR